MAGVALALLALLLLLWAVRRPIAQHFVDRELARRGVPARYRIADLGLGRQRLTDVLIGDPTRPDLIADWIETDTTVGFSGGRLAGVRAGHVRLRARLIGGRLSLGSLDRLLPAPAQEGKPFRLPALALDVADARVALATPAGPVALRLSGKGGLADGFRGTLIGRADRLALRGCSMENVAATVALATERGVPRLGGPIVARHFACAGVSGQQPRVTLAVSLGAELDRLDGQVRLASGPVRGAGVSATGMGGIVAGQGRVADWKGRADLTINDPAGMDARAAALRLIADLHHDGRKDAADGAVWVRDAALAQRWRALPAKWGEAVPGTPAAPIIRQIGVALTRAGAAFDAGARMDVERSAGGSVRAFMDAAQLRSRSGVRLDARPMLDLMRRRWWQMPRGEGSLALAGGGLPNLRADILPARPGQPLRAAIRMEPFAAGHARLALTPVALSLDGQGWRTETRASLTGPLGDGEIVGVAAPIQATARGGRLTLNPGCTPVSWQRVTAGGLVAGPAALRLCAAGAALITLADGRIGGGARLDPARLTGRIGQSPLSLAWGGAEAYLSGPRFALKGLEVRLGEPGRQTRLDVAQLSGTLSGGLLTGGFEGAGGQIGAVPLVLSEAQGGWKLAGGQLALTGGMRVTDAVDPARFQPLAAREVALTLQHGAIRATGSLHEPGSGSRVAEVSISHDLAKGAGEATLRVPAIAFTPDFQPDRLTRLTFGVIADVRGTVSGDARIAWSAAGVTSTGTFRTAGTDLAAAFGPVTGLSTEIRFADLLALQSAPGQVATVASINPGVPVENGIVRYQTLPDTRIRVEGGRWPFAGGTLTLEPTLLDFGTAGERRMTFTLDGVAADRFLQQFDFKNLTATGVFDGTLPMIFDASGGRIENGRLSVRPGGGSLAYVGEISQKDVGFWGNLAFGALRSLRYRDLAIAMNGSLAGEMVTDVRFSGVSQGQGAVSNFLIRRLQRLPFVFNVRIKAPFRGLIDSAQGFYDPRRLIERNLPALIEQQNRRTVQPPESEPVP